MIDFYDGQITDIMPNSYTDEASVQAISLALRDGIRLLYDYAARVYMYASIDTMPEELLDYLAIELRTQYYSQDMDIEIKRNLVKNTLLWYMRAGTPAAVEELVAIVFGYGSVDEWFDYGGEPYWFVITTDVEMEEYNIEYFSEMVKRVKNTRSHLGAISVHREIYQTLYAGAAVFPMYHPEPITDGHSVNYQILQTLYTNAAGETLYHPAAIMEDLKYEGEPVNETVCAGAALASKYTSTIKEES